MTGVTWEEALEIAREVREGKSRSYVRASKDLADFVLERSSSDLLSALGRLAKWNVALQSAMEQAIDIAKEYRGETCAARMSCVLESALEGNRGKT